MCRIRRITKTSSSSKTRLTLIAPKVVDDGIGAGRHEVAPDAIVCANGDMAFGAQALPRSALGGKGGNLTGTIEQKPGSQGRRAVYILVGFLRDREKSTEQVTQLAPVAITTRISRRSSALGK
jgi:hypothetical protein